MDFHYYFQLDFQSILIGVSLKFPLEISNGFSMGYISISLEFPSKIHWNLNIISIGFSLFLHWNFYWILIGFPMDFLWNFHEIVRKTLILVSKHKTERQKISTCNRLSQTTTYYHGLPETATDCQRLTKHTTDYQRLRGSCTKKNS